MIVLSSSKTFLVQWRKILLLGFFFVNPRSSSSQSLDNILSSDPALSSSAVQVLIFVTFLSVLPVLVVMLSSFPFIVTVLSILRQALGLQQTPPNLLIISLSLFLSLFIMEPVLKSAWVDGAEPFLSGSASFQESASTAFVPFKSFMESRVDPFTLSSLRELRGVKEIEASSLSYKASILIPAFLLSELSRAFEVGFLIFLPFLIIDVVIAAILMAMGMMMVPPVVVSLPFKLAFFSLVDGWTLISLSLVNGYGI